MRAVATDVHRSGLRRRTALMSAGMRGNQPLVELLLKRSAPTSNSLLGTTKPRHLMPARRAIARLQRCLKGERGTTSAPISRILVAKRSGLGTTFDLFCVDFPPTGVGPRRST